MMRYVRSFGLSFFVTVCLFLIVGVKLGLSPLLSVAILALVECAFSFDNAVVNARILGRLQPIWRQLFLSAGVLFAVFGARLLLPLLIVAVTARTSVGSVLQMAFHNPGQYALRLQAAHQSVVAFGGAFLLMLALHFFMAEHAVQWLRPLERRLRAWASWWLPLAVTIALLLCVSYLPGNRDHAKTLLAGLIGAFSYFGLHQFLEWMEGKVGADHSRGASSALALLVYLEILDTSLSLDGVLGAFAITNQIILITIGLGIGALWVRSLTVYMVRNRTLATYQYLEYGAHYAIAVLALSMLADTITTIPSLAVGLGCLAILGLSLRTSRMDLP